MRDLIADYAADIENKLHSVEADKLHSMDESLAIDFSEHFAFQDAQAMLFASGKITLNDAELCYNALGAIYTEGNGGWHKNTTLAMKYTITKMVEEHLASRLGKV